MWIGLIKQYWNISLLREKPENTPYSLFLTCIISLIFFVLIILQWMVADINQKLSLGVACLIAGSLILSYMLYTWVLLFLFRLPSHFLQTLTCLLAAHTVVHVVAFPLLLILPIFFNGQAAVVVGPFIGIFYLIMTLLLAIWQFIVSAYIYRHALEVSSLAAMLAAFGLLACNILIISFW